MRQASGVLDSLPLDRFAAAATVISPVVAWLSIGSPTDLTHEYAVSLVPPCMNLVACALLSAGAVVFYRSATSWLGTLQWLVVGALLALTVVWGFSLGPLFVPTLICASIAAGLSDGLASRAVAARVAAGLVGAVLQLVVVWAGGYLHLANVDLVP